MHDQRTEAERRAGKINPALIVRTNRANEPTWQATWRDSTKKAVNRSIGKAWLDRRPPLKNPFDPESEGREKKDEPRTQETWRERWERRSGRAKGGLLDERQAFLAARERVVERELELLAAERAEEGAPSTFGQLADLWLQEKAAEVEDEALKRSTYRDYASVLARPSAPMRARGSGRQDAAHVMREFEDASIEAITSGDLESFERKLRSRGLSPATRKKIKAILRMVFALAVNRGWLSQNPAISQGRQKARKPREKALVVYDLATVERIAEKAATIKSRRKDYAMADALVADLIRLAALTGLRQGELLALRWADIDFISRKITISLTHVANQQEDEAPKSNRLRSIPLSDQAAVVLDRVSRRGVLTRKNDLVFCNPSALHLDASWLRKRYARARDQVITETQRAGDEMPVVVFHGLRHTFGTCLAAAGVPLSEIQALMGHADISTTMIYVHYQPQHDAADRLSAAFREGTPDAIERVAEVA